MASRATLQGGGLLFLFKFSEIPGTHSWYSSIYLRKIPMGPLDWEFKSVNVFVAWKDLKFQKSYNFPGSRILKRLLLDLLIIKLNCSY